MPHIVTLSVGRDPLLLQTRGQVLRKDGYTVASTASSDQALQQFVAGDFDMVILCHSIPAQERERLADAIHRHSPNTPVVVVAAGFSGKDPAVHATYQRVLAALGALGPFTAEAKKTFEQAKERFPNSERVAEMLKIASSRIGPPRAPMSDPARSATGSSTERSECRLVAAQAARSTVSGAGSSDCGSRRV